MKFGEIKIESPFLFNVFINSLYRTTGDNSYIVMPFLPYKIGDLDSV